MNGTLLKTGQAAELLGVSRQHVVNLCDRGSLRSLRLGAHRLVKKSDVEQLVQESSLTREQERQLWLHQAMLTHLLTRPDEVLALARQNIDRWLPMHRSDGRSAAYLREWEQIVERGLGETVRAVLSTSPHSCELRQNSPFAGVLTDDERVAALRSFRLSHPATT